MKFLVVEDEIKLGQAIEQGLKQEGYVVDLATDFEQGEHLSEVEAYDLIILDRMLPGGQDGLEIAQGLRRRGDKTPVLMLTAMGEVGNRVEGLNEGADDYLVKPFHFDELLARIRALLRRPSEAHQPVRQIGDLRVDTARKQVMKAGKQVSLSKREYALLEYFLQHPERTLSKDDLISNVWDFEANILPNTVEVFIRSLRNKLDLPGQPSVVETVRGFGYRLGSV